MALDVALASSDATVRTRPFRRDTTWSLGDAGPYAVVHPLAPPRLWSAVTSVLTHALATALKGQPPSSNALRAAAEACAAGLGRLRGQLIEPSVTLDAQLGLIATDGRTVYGALTSGVRFYRARGGVPERLHSNAARPDGVNAGALHVFAEPVAPADLFVLGTRETFSMRAMGNLASSLARPGVAAAQQLCESVVEPARGSGTASAVVVLRLS